MKKIIILLLSLVFVSQLVSAGGVAATLSWEYGGDNFVVYEGATPVCSAAITDTDNEITECSGGNIEDSTDYCFEYNISAYAGGEEYEATYKIASGEEPANGYFDVVGVMGAGNIFGDGASVTNCTLTGLEGAELKNPPIICGAFIHSAPETDIIQLYISSGSGEIKLKATTVHEKVGVRVCITTGTGTTSDDSTYLYTYESKYGSTERSSNISFIAGAAGDSDPPTVNLNSPIDNFNTSGSVTFNGTASDDINLANVTLYGNWTGSWVANETNSSPVNNTPTIFSKTIPGGTFRWNIYACDNSSNCAFAAANRTFTVDATPPVVVSLDYPGNDSVVNSGLIDFNFTATDNRDLANCTLYTDFSGWAANETVNNPTNNTETNITIDPPEGIFIWNVLCYDSLGNSDWFTNNYTINIDSTAPTSTINAPGNDSTVSDNTPDIRITLTDNMANSVNYTFYINDSVNKTGTVANNTATNITMDTLADGLWLIIVEATDNASNSYNSSTLYLTIDTEPPQWFDNSTNSTLAGTTINHSVNWTDENGLEGYIFSFDNGTGSFVNDSYVTFSGTQNWSNVVKSVNTTADSTIRWRVYANDTTDNLNVTGIFQYTTTVIDTTYPQFSGFTENPSNNSLYSFGQNYQFNSTVIDTNGTVWLDINGTNYSATNDSINNFYASISGLSAGTHNYYWWAYGNGSSNNFNASATRVYTIQQAVPIGSLTNDTVLTREYDGSATAIGISESNSGDGDLTYTIYKDNVNVGSSDTEAATGTYNYVLNTTGGQNYTANASMDLFTLTINQNTGSCSVLFNDTSPRTYLETFTVWSNCTSDFILYRNGTTISNNSVQSLAAGSHNFTAIRNDIVNYINTYDEQTFVVNRAASVVFTYLNNSRSNITIGQGTSIYLNTTTSVGDSGATLNLYNNGSLINQGTSPLSNLTNFPSIGVFNITGIYDESQNFTADSETWWVNVTVAPDLTNPSVTSLTETPAGPATYSEAATYEFNATITDNIELDDVSIEFDGVNYTPTNVAGDVYNFTITDLAVGTYNYRWYANDTSGNMNDTENGSYTINQTTPTLNLTISPSNSETYGTETTATGSNCPFPLTCNLYRDGASISNPEIITLAVGIYNYTYNTTGNTNYTSASVSENLTITQATGNIAVYLNNSRSNITIDNATSIYLNATLVTGSGNIELYNNNTLINQGTSPLSNLTQFITVGLYNITAIYSGNENYTSDSEVWWLNVTPKVIDIEMGEFNGTTSNLTNMSNAELENISNLILEVSNYGKILFLENINISDDIDLDANIEVGDNSIELNSDVLTNFNKAARLYLYNLTFSNPRILRDAVVCSSAICTQINYSGGTLVFNVTGFTTYSAQQTPTVTPPGGGGSGSEGGVECTEDSQCVGDEVCFNFQCVVLFDVKIIDFESPIMLGEFFDFTYFLKGMADINEDVRVEFWIEKEGKEITSGSDIIYFGSFDEKTETTKIFLPENVDSGIYDFIVQVNYQGYSARADRIIEISVGEGGIARIKSIGDRDSGIYAIIALIIMSILVLSLIFYLERKKIKKGIESGLAQETKWIKRHKISVLVFILFILLGALAYFLGLFDLIGGRIFALILWIKIFYLPFLIAIISLAVLVIIIRLIRLWKLKRKLKKLLGTKPEPKPTVKKQGKEARKSSKIYLIYRRFVRGISHTLETIKNYKIKPYRLDPEELFKEKEKKRVIKKRKVSTHILKSLIGALKNFYMQLSKILKRDSIKITEFWSIKATPPTIQTKKLEEHIKESTVFKPLPEKTRIFKLLTQTVKNLINGISEFFKHLFRKLKSSIVRGEEDLAKERRRIINKGNRAMEEIHKDVFYLLNKIFGKKSRETIIQNFEEVFVKTGRFAQRHLRTLKAITYQDILYTEKEAKHLIYDLVGYLREFEVREKKKIRKTEAWSEKRSIRVLQTIKYDLSNTLVVIHNYLIKMHVFYLRAIYRVKMRFFSGRMEIVNLIRGLENRELLEITQRARKEVDEVLRKKRIMRRRRFFEGEVFEEKKKFWESDFSGEKIEESIIKPVEKPREKISLEEKIKEGRMVRPTRKFSWKPIIRPSEKPKEKISLEKELKSKPAQRPLPKTLKEEPAERPVERPKRIPLLERLEKEIKQPRQKPKQVQKIKDPKNIIEDMVEREKKKKLRRKGF